MQAHEVGDMSANDNKAVEAAKGADDGPRMEDMVDDMSGGERFAELPRFGPPRAVKQVSALDAIAPAAAASPRAEVIAAADVLSSATGSAETAIPAVAAGSAAPVEEVAAADVAVVQAEPAGASSEGGTQAAVAAAVAAQEAQYVAQVVNAEPKFVLDAVDDPIAELAAMTVGPEAAPGGASSIGGLNALRAAVSDVMAQRAPDAPVSNLTDAELASVAQRLQMLGGIRPDQMQASAPQQVQPQGGGVAQVSGGQKVQMQGGAALGDGLASAVGGVFSLVGAAGKAVGAVAGGIAGLAGDKNKASAPSAAPMISGPAVPLPTSEAVVQQGGIGTEHVTAVLPRLSEYRVVQAEKAVQAFSQEQDAFWKSSPKLTALRGELEKLARERGLPVSDIAAQMKPGGEFDGLRAKFNEAVNETPEAATHRRSMDKALTSYVRQYSRAREEELNPDQKGNKHYDDLKARLQRSCENMEQKAGVMPAFQKASGELEQSHLEKLRESLAAIMEKIKEMAKDVIDFLRGKRGVDHAAAP